MDMACVVLCLTWAYFEPEITCRQQWGKGSAIWNLIYGAFEITISAIIRIPMVFHIYLFPIPLITKKPSMHIARPCNIYLIPNTYLAIINFSLTIGSRYANSGRKIDNCSSFMIIVLSLRKLFISWWKFKLIFNKTTTYFFLVRFLISSCAIGFFFQKFRSKIVTSSEQQLVVTHIRHKMAELVEHNKSIGVGGWLFTQMCG